MCKVWWCTGLSLHHHFINSFSLFLIDLIVSPCAHTNKHRRWWKSVLYLFPWLQQMQRINIHIRMCVKLSCHSAACYAKMPESERKYQRVKDDDGEKEADNRVFCLKSIQMDVNSILSKRLLQTKTGNFQQQKNIVVVIRLFMLCVLGKNGFWAAVGAMYNETWMGPSIQ